MSLEFLIADYNDDVTQGMPLSQFGKSMAKPRRIERIPQVLQRVVTLWSCHFCYCIKHEKNNIKIIHSTISSIVSKQIGVIRRVKFYLPPATLNLLANALVFPHFDYCSPVWTNCISEFFISPQILQNKLARVLSADIRIPISDIMNTLCWDKLHERWNK